MTVTPNNIWQQPHAAKNLKALFEYFIKRYKPAL